jgi:transposase-like protein
VLNTLPLSWPFAVWGLDILGPFPKAGGGYEWLYVAIDKFTKWPEVTMVIKANKGSVLKFINDLVTQFEFPNQIITDNGT